MKDLGRRLSGLWLANKRRRREPAAEEDPKLTGQAFKLLPVGVTDSLQMEHE